MAAESGADLELARVAPGMVDVQTPVLVQAQAQA
jgi:hypothetical protein